MDGLVAANLYTRDAQVRIAELERALAAERASRTVNRAHIAGLEAVVRAIAATNPEAVRAVVETVFSPAFLARAQELALGDFYSNGAEAVAVKARAAQDSTLQDCVEGR